MIYYDVYLFWRGVHVQASLISKVIQEIKIFFLTFYKLMTMLYLLDTSTHLSLDTRFQNKYKLFLSLSIYKKRKITYEILTFIYGNLQELSTKIQI